MKRFVTNLVALILLCGSLVPVFAGAQTFDPTLDPESTSYTGLRFCDGVSDDPNRVCNFRTFVGAVNQLINFMFILVGPVAIVLMVYAGFLIMTGEDEKIKKGKSFFWHVLIGLIMMLSSALVIKVLLSLITDDKFGFIKLIQ